MCGITGLILKKNLSQTITQIIGNMVKSIHHRGPDDQDVYINTNKNFALGHVRLSILDLSQNGHQPMIDQETGVVLVYNGEVYNFSNIRSELEKLDFIFTSHCDTEVILKAYIQWGTNAFKKFDGMFALGLYDPRINKLILTRDFAGIKPLYFADTPEGFFFGSEIKALLASQAISKNISYPALAKYLTYGHSCGEQTIYQSIQKLPSGTYLTFDLINHRYEINPYWSALEYLNKTQDSIYSESEAALAIKNTLENSIASQLISDVPLGICLSGGIDSSAITALASAHYPGKLQTFSVDFDFMRAGSELPMANLIAKEFNTEHHTFQITGKNIASTVQASIQWHDEPFGYSANLPLFLISEKLKQTDIKVLLQGDGGDELFAGYPHYQGLPFLKTLRRLKPWIQPFLPLLPNTHFFNRRKAYFELLTNTPIEDLHAYLLTVDNPKQFSGAAYFTPDIKIKLYETDRLETYKKLYQLTPHIDPTQRALYMDYMILLQHQFLEKVDRPMMANSIEVRVPFLGKDVVELALGLPSSYKVHGKEKKYLLRKALRGVIPNKILDAPKKGFGVPFDHWLKKDLLNLLKHSTDFLHSRGLTEKTWVDLKIQEHTKGKINHGPTLWKLMLLGLWLEANPEVSF